jgi:hypothetical protein
MIVRGGGIKLNSMKKLRFIIWGTLFFIGVFIGILVSL